MCCLQKSKLSLRWQHQIHFLPLFVASSWSSGNLETAWHSKVVIYLCIYFCPTFIFINKNKAANIPNITSSSYVLYNNNAVKWVRLREDDWSKVTQCAFIPKLGLELKVFWFLNQDFNLLPGKQTWFHYYWTMTCWRNISHSYPITLMWVL